MIINKIQWFADEYKLLADLTTAFDDLQGADERRGVVEVEVVAVTGDTDLPPATGTTLTEDRLHTMTTTDTLQGMTAEDLPQRGDYDTQFWKSFHLVS